MKEKRTKEEQERLEAKWKEEWMKQNKVKKLDSKDFSKEHSGQKMFMKGY